MWFILYGKITLHDAEIRGTESEFRAWLDENWILAPGTEVSFSPDGKLTIVWAISDDTDEDLGYFTFTDDDYMDPIPEIPATPKNVDYDTDEWGFLSVGFSKANMENLLSPIGQEWLTGAAYITWDGFDRDEYGDEFPVTGFSLLTTNGNLIYGSDELPDLTD